MSRLCLFTILLAGTGLLPDIGVSGQEPVSTKSVKLNQGALEYARDLIKHGHVVNDKHGAWAQDQPSVEDENEFIDQHGYEEYAHWHLGFDESHSSNSKASYKFPFGDFKNVHRCALIAIQYRARRYHYSDIENAANELLALLEKEVARNSLSNRRDELCLVPLIDVMPL